MPPDPLWEALPVRELYPAPQVWTCLGSMLEANAQVLVLVASPERAGLLHELRKVLPPGRTEVLSLATVNTEVLAAHLKGFAVRELPADLLKRGGPERWVTIRRQQRRSVCRRVLVAYREADDAFAQRLVALIDGRHDEAGRWVEAWAYPFGEEFSLRWLKGLPGLWGQWLNGDRRGIERAPARGVFERVGRFVAGLAVAKWSGEYDLVIVEREAADKAEVSFSGRALTTRVAEGAVDRVIAVLPGLAVGEHSLSLPARAYTGAIRIPPSETSPDMAAAKVAERLLALRLEAIGGGSFAEADHEYIIVGSGAGGGTLAARLAERGHKVLLLEAGGDPIRLQGGNALDPDANRLPMDYEIPFFHAIATENEAIGWDFWVRHYAADDLQKKDPKYRESWDGRRVDGVLYPRAGCLGGCTANSAMIAVYPHNEDWDHLAQITGDPSWNADKMRRYFEKIENCQHRLPLYRWMARLGFNPTRHGWNGWLQTEKSIPKTALRDRDLLKTLRASTREALIALGDLLSRIEWFIQGQADPNDWRLVRKNAYGIHYTPLLTRNHSRLGTRERLLEVQRSYPSNLTIELDALVTRVLLDQNNRAIGVEYLKGKRLYRAHKNPSRETGQKRQVRASREVILAGGAFNTPQLLMLSGIGPRQEIQKHGIAVRVDLPGVGSNLQDRYELGAVNRMSFDHWEALKGVKYGKGDPHYAQWERERSGVYTTNGAVLAVIKRSLPERPLPDLFCYALLAKFAGYFPNYSVDTTQLNYLTWAVLKAHTNNTAGEVRLKSTDPRDRPYINFRYFDEGNDTRGADLDSVVEGIKFVRKLTAPLKAKGLIAEEELPGDKVQSDDLMSSR